jgi:hypothetical protein
MNNDAYNRYAKEEYFESTAEHGPCENLCKQENPICPSKDGRKQLVQSLRGLIVEGSVVYIRDEAEGRGEHQEQGLEKCILRLCEEGEEKDEYDFLYCLIEIRFRVDPIIK